MLHTYGRRRWDRIDGIDDYAYKACEIDEAGGGELIKYWDSDRETIQEDDQEAEFEKLRGLLGLM